MLSKSELLPLTICPACKASLTSFDRCHSCGGEFSVVDGTPSLFAKKESSRTVSFEFRPEQSIMGEIFRAAFKYPKRRGAASGPYHLDQAHIDIIDLLPSESLILEIGCGGGQMRSFVQDKGHRYVGTDISKTRVDEQLQKHGGPDILCDAHFLPFIDEGFDLIYSSAVTEHLACPYLVAQEISRALKPGGYYLGNVSFMEPWHDDSFFHMSPLGVFALLSQARFEAKYIWPGQGYSGFRAILAMGNKATRPLRFVGDALNFAYRSGNQLRNLAKRRENWSQDLIEDAAKVAGATDWIARKPV